MSKIKVTITLVKEYEINPDWYPGCNSDEQRLESELKALREKDHDHLEPFDSVDIQGEIVGQELSMYEYECQGVYDWVIAASEQEATEMMEQQGYSWLGDAKMVKLVPGTIREFTHEEVVSQWIKIFGRGYIGSSDD